MSRLLRVWWTPQVPGKPFYHYINKVSEGVKVMGILSDYDKFNGIESVGGIQMLMGGNISNDDDWVSWRDKETGEENPAEWLADLI